uniref:Uncharacterized protein n=1 Tax=Meloidogyne enterolobii TaxID=390850 RepID=A0A6V7V8X2_MELEN|nr:unnamed protein product [Meloidogyne enterolobii]CAD2191480.1 unnamed protein product [Meloidogyne enterolobii]CAD2202084.1 unnamed protein product [Meloidogyne enterolobii]CAD2202508.1 unnamed protein product [Meloidogyne enterolobii]CAD2206091.1 unnamed protein product [Meloidogyne enterolobii]
MEAINIETAPTKISKSKAASEPFWKLFRGKFLMTFSLCADCRDNVFKKSDKAVRKDDKIEIKFEICEVCFKKNCKTTDILSPYTPKIK